MSSPPASTGRYDPTMAEVPCIACSFPPFARDFTIEQRGA